MALPLRFRLRLTCPFWPVGEGRLRQVFLNLLDNAVKLSRPGDAVTVCLQPMADGAACAVCDTGPAIPAEHLPYITQRFYRAVPHDEAGSGLGEPRNHRATEGRKGYGRGRDSGR